MLDNVIATFVSTIIGGEVRGWVFICATVILEGLNVSKANLQLESVWLQLPPGYYLREWGLIIRRSQRTLITTSRNFVKEDSVIV